MPTNRDERVRALEAEVQRLERERLERLELPHLHGKPMYAWMREFFDVEGRDAYLCAANQIGKSSINIRKCIDWATNPVKQQRLWGRKPIQFWYLYPTKDIATIEFETKWVKENLPRGSHKNHPVYGWKRQLKHKHIWSLEFNSGVTVYFKTYAQDKQYLQAGSCDALFPDEEYEEDIYDELNMRRRGTKGFISMVFTATLGQEFFREIIEERGPKERFAEAWKRQVSLYDCRRYEDGQLSPWTDARIEEAVRSCKSEAEVERRINGRFVLDTGRKVEGFEPQRNVRQPLGPPPADWTIFSGVDLGSGGKGHPSAIAFVAVRPDLRFARVFRGWRGDGIHTTNSDVLQKYRELRGALKPVVQSYDWHSRDFFLLASRAGEAFTPAEKGQDLGFGTLNVLFKNGMLVVDEGDEELKKLATECMTLRLSKGKSQAKDDFVDALRYAVMPVPWDWTVLGEGVKLLPPPTREDLMSADERWRRGLDRQNIDEQSDAVLNELEEANDYYDV
jgi:phage terminase large subunit-like protein